MLVYSMSYHIMSDFKFPAFSQTFLFYVNTNIPICQQHQPKTNEAEELQKLVLIRLPEERFIGNTPF